MSKSLLTTLDNGAKVLCLQRPNFHTSSVRIKIYAGSLHETVPGSAHFFEHIAFQGTDDFPSQQELEDYCNENAIFKNAYTSKVETVFFADGLELDATLKVATQIAYHPLITEESLEKERAAVIDEARGFQFAPGADAMKEHLIAIGGEPCGNLICGTIDQIERITHKDLLEFHSKQYHTNNTLIVVCSNEPVEKQLELVTKFIKKTATKKAVRSTPLGLKWLPEENGLSLQNNKLDPQSQTYISTVYKTPNPQTYNEFLRLTTAAIVLNKVAHKYLRQELVLCYSARASLSTLINQNYGADETHSALYIYTYTSGEVAQKALKELLQVPAKALKMTKLIESIIQQSTYEAAVMLEETTASAASNMVRSEQIRFDGEYNPDSFLKLVKETTVNDVIEDIKSITKTLSCTQITSPDQKILDSFER